MRGGARGGAPAPAGGREACAGPMPGPRAGAAWGVAGRGVPCREQGGVAGRFERRCAGAVGAVGRARPGWGCVWGAWSVICFAACWRRLGPAPGILFSRRGGAPGVGRGVFCMGARRAGQGGGCPGLKGAGRAAA